MSPAATQSVEYRGATQGDALAAFLVDAPRAAGWGHRPFAESWRIDGAEQVFAVTFAFVPDPMIVRRYPGSSPHDAEKRYALDRLAMFNAGYVPTSTVWEHDGPSPVSVLASACLRLRVLPAC